MSRFTYTARGPNGHVGGLQEAGSAALVAAELQSRGLIPLSIKEDGETNSAAKSGDAVKLPAFMAPKIHPMDVMLFSRQLYTLFKAGVPILRALSGLQETTQNVTFKEVVLSLRQNLESGVELSACMAMHPKVFDNFYVAMIKMGEASGRLDEIFSRLADHLEFEMFMSQQVKAALRYPSFVVMAMAAAIGVINVMVVPAFAGVFKSLGADLPMPTKILVASSDFTIHHGWAILITTVLAYIVWFQWAKKTPSGRLTWDRLLLKMPLIGPIMTKAALSRFARSFSMSLSGGVPLERALIGVAQSSNNAYLSQRIDHMRERVMRGEPLANAAAAAGIFTPMVLQMISIGEETGMVDELLEQVGELYSEEVQYALKTLAQQIEPILIVFMGGLVLILALGVFLPMWNMGQAAIKH